jgi:hypothetical protein
LSTVAQKLFKRFEPVTAFEAEFGFIWLVVGALQSVCLAKKPSSSGLDVSASTMIIDLRAAARTDCDFVSNLPLQVYMVVRLKK